MAMMSALSSSADAISPRLKLEDDELELWNRLRKRTKSLACDHQQKINPEQDERTKSVVCEEDIKLLDKGLDAVASSLTQLTQTLGNAVEEGSNLAEPRLSNLFPIGKPDSPSTLKRKRLTDSTEQVLGDGEDDPKSSAKLRDHRNIAIAMASKAKFLEREVKSLKADLCFMRERCCFLEEENRRLRDSGDVKGERPEEDDLVRLQLEALLAEKGRLAQENANYARENQYLHQLVEYHQLTLQDMDAFDESMPMPAVCLDFSPASPVN